MSKLYFLGLLLYQIAIVSCIPLENVSNLHQDSDDDVEYNLQELSKTFDEKPREYRRNTLDDKLESWTGRWMPDRSGDPTPPPKIWPATVATHTNAHRIQMGSDYNCDDGKTDLTVDWDNSPVNYTCYGPKITPNFDIDALLHTETIPPEYVAQHKCMNETINYDENIPVYGTHRPVWPTYGEYKFIPKQRWLHSLEHGALVMLYHPCANPLEVKRLKSLVTGCLQRHIISPYNLVEEDRPLVLVTWGSRLSMSYVNTEIVQDFIRNNALHGPEKIRRDGGFVEGLLYKSQIVSDEVDTIICPNM